MKKIAASVFLLFAILIGCTTRDGEIIDLINSVKKQNDDLKAQISALKKTTDSALVAINKVTVSQAVTDKKLDAIQADLRAVLAQISSLSVQMTSNNADLASIKSKLDALQVKCAELVAQIGALTITLNSTLVDLKKQVATLKNTSDSALLVITKLSVAQANDKNIVSVQAELKNVLAQIASLSNQLSASNVDITSLKSRIDALQVKVDQLVGQLDDISKTANLKNGLVAYYPFRGNANDESGNGNNGSVNGATLAMDRNGNSGNAYYFNGISNYVSFSLNSIGNAINISSEFTTSIWVKTSDLYGPLISMQGVGGFEYDFHIGTLADVVQNPGNYGMLVRDNCCGTGNNIFGSNVVNNIWHMLTVIRLRGGTLKLYKDGILDATSSEGQGGSLKFSPNFIAFGADLSWVNGGSNCNSCNSNDQQHLNGMLDDISIWNRALTQSEITYLYNH